MRIAALPWLLPAPAAAQPLAVHVRESATYLVPGATAAHAIDAAGADASATNGPVHNYGRAGGRTQIVVVTVSGQSSFDVVVTSSQPLVPQAKQATDGRVETRYASVGR